MLFSFNFFLAIHPSPLIFFSSIHFLLSSLKISLPLSSHHLSFPTHLPISLLSVSISLTPLFLSLSFFFSLSPSFYLSHIFSHLKITHSHTLLHIHLCRPIYVQIVDDTRSIENGFLL